MIAREDLLPQVAGRIHWIRRALIAIVVALLAYLFDMQVLRTGEFRAAAELNSVKRVTIRAPRGLLLDRDGRVLVKNRPSFDAVVRVDAMSDVAATLARARSVLGLDPAAGERLRKKLRRKDYAEIPVKEDLSLAEVAALEARAYEWPEFRVREGLARSYPYASSAAHAFGHMGEIQDDQLTSPAFRAYAPGDVVGQTGLEARYERYLRGRDGARRVLVNATGREIRVLDQIDPPVPGLDLHLTLDLDVQRAAEEAFGDQRGAAVAIDNQTGEVLALVSRPAFDPNAFAGKMTGAGWQRYATDPAHPLFDRALLGKLPPGSVFKIVDSIAGLEERVWDPDARITCNGQTVVHGDVFHCWKKEGHGSVDFHDALRGSCNVYFYHRGDAVGIDRLSRWAHRLGLGEKTGIDIDNEGRGLVPDPAWKRTALGQPWWPGETVSVAIGQGALAVSVLQISSLGQVVANSGTAYVPFLVEQVGEGGARRAPQVAREVTLRPDTLTLLKDALWAVVNEVHGTGGKARIEGFDVCGKTGTAQPPASGEESGAPHAWFVGYAPGKAPVVVAAVFVEHGGHGGDAAAPIARAMIAKVLEKRGLKTTDAPASTPAPGVGLVFLGPPRPDLAATRVSPVFLGPPRLGGPTLTGVLPAASGSRFTAGRVVSREPRDARGIGPAGVAPSLAAAPSYRLKPARASASRHRLPLRASAPDPEPASR